MKHSDVRFPHETSDGYLLRCLNTNATVAPAGFDSADDYRSHVSWLIDSAANTEDLIDMILDDEAMRFTQIAAELSKRERPAGHWLRIRQLFGDRQFKTVSDSGGLKIGNAAFSVLVPNGRGDGVTRVAVFSSNEVPSGHLFDMMSYWTRVSGDIDIYSADCGSDVCTTIHGAYDVYFYDGFIAFEAV